MALITIALSLFSTLAFAADAPQAVGMSCTTRPLTTSFAVFTRGLTVTVRVIHHNGTDYMPIAGQDVVAASDLQRLQQDAAALASLGEQYDLQIDLSQCHSRAKGLLACEGPIEQKLGTHHFTWLSLEVGQAVIVSPSIAAPFIEGWVRYGFTMDQHDYSFRDVYPAGGCVETLGAVRKLVL